MDNLEVQAEHLATKHYLSQGIFGGITKQGRTKYFDFSAAKDHYFKKLQNAKKK